MDESQELCAGSSRPRTHDHMISFVWCYRKAGTTDQWLLGATGKGLTAREPKRTFGGNRTVRYLNYHGGVPKCILLCMYTFCVIELYT